MLPRGARLAVWEELGDAGGQRGKKASTEATGKGFQKADVVGCREG